MGYNASKAEEVYNTMARMGYDKGLCEVVSKQMCTDWTAMRFLGYLHQCGRVKEEELVDEMLGILGDRDRIVQKHEMEFYQGKINEIYNYGLFDDEDD